MYYNFFLHFYHYVSRRKVNKFAGFWNVKNVKWNLVAILIAVHRKNSANLIKMITFIFSISCVFFYSNMKKDEFVWICVFRVIIDIYSISNFQYWNTSYINYPLNIWRTWIPLRIGIQMSLNFNRVLLTSSKGKNIYR